MNEEGKQIEYQNLRSEILHSDRICLSILAFLMTSTLTCYGIVAKHSILELILLISMVWTLGYYYISEKRFLIVKIAYYLMTEIEDEKRGLFWENWLAKNKSILDKKFLRWDPYYLETAYALSIVTLNPILLLILSNFENPVSRVMVIYFVILLIFWVVVIYTAIKALRKYNPHEEN